jgi:hypothetical protein
MKAISERKASAAISRFNRAFDNESRTPGKKTKTFKNMALSLSTMISALNKAEKMFTNLPYVNGAWGVRVSDEDNFAPETYLHYRIEKRNYSWNDTIRTLLNTSQARIITMIARQNMDQLLRNMQSMSRSRRAEIYRLLMAQNQQEYDKSALWYVRFLAVVRSRVKTTPEGGQKREIFAMEIVISRKEGYRDDSHEELKKPDYMAPEYNEGYGSTKFLTVPLPLQ